MSKRRALGRGLNSLIPETSSTQPAEGGSLSIPLSSISPNPHQPRENIDQRKLEELAASIREHGLIQPLVVNRAGDGRYTIIAGERRWRAAGLAGLAEVPVVIKEASSQSMLELALVENIQRADLNALEEAQAYRHLMDEFGLTQEEVSGRVGKSRSTVANSVRLLNLPENVRAAVIDGSISGAHARALLPLTTAEVQTAVMNQVISRGLSVRQVEEIVKKLLIEKKPELKAAPRLSPEMAALKSDFESHLGMRVDIQKRAKSGKVIIHFYSDEELQAIYEAIIRE